jgi:hypothetical protein
MTTRNGNPESRPTGEMLEDLVERLLSGMAPLDTAAAVALYKDFLDLYGAI